MWIFLDALRQLEQEVLGEQLTADGSSLLSRVARDRSEGMTQWEAPGA